MVVAFRWPKMAAVMEAVAVVEAVACVISVCAPHEDHRRGHYRHLDARMG
jgi:hypothetical protein